MVVGAFPIAKLSVLLIKQISKPIANACKERAKSHPFFRTYVCMPPAQFYNWCEVKAKMWILNLGKPVNIPVLSQQMAIELGANLLGEGLIFVIGAGLIIIEYNRQSKKETAKEAKREEEMEQIKGTLTDLYFSVQQQQTQLREMERLVLFHTGKKPKDLPPAPVLPPLKIPISNASENLTPQNVKYSSEDNREDIVYKTPYPDRGVILKSLNYIQMDVFSSSIFSSSENHKPDSNDKSRETDVAASRQESAVITSALHNIENNFRSLF